MKSSYFTRIYPKGNLPSWHDFSGVLIVGHPVLARFRTFPDEYPDPMEGEKPFAEQLQRWMGELEVADAQLAAVFVEGEGYSGLYVTTIKRIGEWRGENPLRRTSLECGSSNPRFESLPKGKASPFPTNCWLAHGMSNDLTESPACGLSIRTRARFLSVERMVMTSG